ncbi:MAG: hypothetical protein HNEKOMLI_00396 [Sodalis sp. Psp]|nr:hypothetical protein [Sodalis sp. Psp]MCR3756880.1 hypothetical protein [Sodalis sp. Ppy]
MIFCHCFPLSIRVLWLHCFVLSLATLLQSCCWRQRITLYITGSLFHHTDNIEEPISHNHGTRQEALAIVNVYNRSMNSSPHDQIGIRKLGSGVITRQKGHLPTNKHIINDAEQLSLRYRMGESMKQ